MVYKHSSSTVVSTEQEKAVQHIGVRRRRETFLPFAIPHITNAEVDEVVDTLRSGWITTGPKTKRFERAFAEHIGTPHALAVNSATAAMHLALDALGLQPGDEVIVPVYTFTATAEVVLYFRAVPVFVDIDPVTCNLSPLELEKHITPRTRAIMVVHMAGLPAEMDDILAIAHAHSLPVIEDAAHAFPAKYKGRTIGTISDMTAFSFYATKTLSTGEGGMLTTANAEYAERVAMMTLHGISRDAWKRYSAEGSWYYEVLQAGFKYNMTDIAASLGLHQLARSEDLLARRRTIAKRYTEAFSQLPELQAPSEPAHIEHAWHLYMLRLRTECLTIGRNEFIQELTGANIGTSVHFIPLHLQSFYQKTFQVQPQDFPIASNEYQREVSLPIYPGMSDKDVEDVIEAVIHITVAHKR